MVDVVVTAEDLYAGLTPAQRDSVASTLSGLVPADAVGPASDALSRLAPAAKQAMAALGSGDALTAVEGSIPIIAGGLAAVGGPVGLAAAGVISAGGYAFGLLADALHLGAQPQEVCTWLVGEVCFNRSRPYGPSQPNGSPNPDWLRIEDFATTTLAMNGDWHSHNAIPVEGLYASWLNVAFDGVDVDDLGWELWSLGDHVSPAAVAWRENKRLGGWNVDDATGQLDNGAGYETDSPSRVLAGTPQGAFLMAFYRAYVHSLEFVINGYEQPDTYGLLLATKAAFDRQHSASSTWTFRPSPRSAPGSGTWLERYLGGQFDQGHTKPPITINAGPDVSALGNVFLKFAAKGKQMASLGTLVEVQAPAPAKPRTISLHGIGEFGRNLAGYKLTVDQKGVLEATRIAPPASDGFTVLGQHVTKKQAIGGGLVAGALLAAKLLF
jgi:hypothetical protein